MKPPMTRAQKEGLYGIIHLVVLLLVVLQLWLLTATMNAWMGGDRSVVWPAALASLGCLAFNGVLLWRLFALEHAGE